MEWFKRHVDSVVVLTAVLGAAVWMTTSIHSLKDDLVGRLNTIEKDMAIIKTVLVMKEVMPKELACHGEKQ